MSTAAPITFESHVVIGSPERPGLLLLPDRAGWRLPAFSEDERHFWQEVGHVSGWLRTHLGAPATTLRCLDIAYQPEQELVSKVYAAVLRDPAWTPPPGARWAVRDELVALPLAHESHRSLLAEWFAWYDNAATPDHRVPWYMPGWYEQATAWATSQLRQAGLRPGGSAEQLRSWQRAAILRLPTAEGAAYLKAVPPVFNHEPALTAALAAAHPGRFAEPIALDPDRGWLLMHELPGTTLDLLRDDHDLPYWEQALATFAEVQIASTRRLPELRALGLPTRPLASLATRLAPLLADPAATLPGRPAGLSPTEREQLLAFATRLDLLSAELAAYALPESLEHGDFWAGQVVVGPQGCGFLDWSDSSLAHPFFSLLLFLVEIEDFFPHEPGVRERLRDAYLEPWATLAPAVDLTRAFELAQPLAALHHALAYHTSVLPNMEIKWEMELMLPFYLKMALRLAT
jgi:hypothetical protein